MRLGSFAVIVVWVDHVGLVGRLLRFHRRWRRERRRMVGRISRPRILHSVVSVELLQIEPFVPSLEYSAYSAISSRCVVDQEGRPC